MNNIMELMEKRAKAWNAAKEFLDAHSENGGNVSAEDAATYDRMEKEVTDLTRDIERLQRQEAIDAMLSQPTSAPLTGRPAAQKDGARTGRASDEYRKAFWDNIRHPGVPAIRDLLEEGSDGNGGYLVPTEFERTLVQALDENNVMRSIGCKIITTANERKIPVADGHTQAVWTAENGAYTESTPTFAQKSIDAFKLTDLIKVSDELLSDSFFDIEGYIADEFGRAFGEAEEEAFINGAVQSGQTAIDRPTGLFAAAASGGAPQGVVAGSATAITSDEQRGVHVAALHDGRRARPPARLRTVYVSEGACHGSRGARRCLWRLLLLLDRRPRGPHDQAPQRTVRDQRPGGLHLHRARRRQADPVRRHPHPRHEGVRNRGHHGKRMPAGS